MATDQERLVLQMSANLRSFEREMARSRQITERRMREVEQRAMQADKNLSRIMERAGRGMVDALKNSLAAVAPTLAAAFSAQQVIRYADAYTSLQNRLKAAGLEGERLKQVEDALYDAANRNGVAVDAVAQLYQRASLSRQALGASDEQLIALTQGVTSALRVQGVTAEQASGPLLQLGQALGGGTVRAEELNSLLEGTPLILQAAANGSAVFRGDVSKLSAAIREGEVSSQAFFNALLKGLPALQSQADGMALTVGGALQTLDNALGRMIGQTDAGLAASQRLAQAIKGLADNLETARDAVVVAAAVIGTTLAARALGQAAVGFTALQAQIALTNAQLAAFELRSAMAAGSLGRMSTAGVAATGAMRGLSAGMAFFGGPIGLAITGIAAGISLLAFSSANARREAEALTAEIERQARAAGTASEETSALKGEITQAQTWVAQMTGEVNKLADAHYRAAAGAKVQAIETARLRLQEANKTLGEAQTAYSDRRRINNQNEANISTPYGTAPRIGGDGNRGDPRTIQSQEFRNLQAQTATVRELTTNLRTLMTTPLASFNAGGTGGASGSGSGGGRGDRASTGPIPEELARQRELLALQGQIELLRAQGRSAEADAVQRRLDIANLEKQYADAGIENARAAAELQVNAVAQAETAARGRVTAQERANELLDMAVEAQRRQNDELLDQVSLEAELARLSGDPRRIEMAERDLYITQRVNDLLRDRVGLITEADRQAAERQAGGEYDDLRTADLTGRVRDEIVDGLRDGLRSLAEGDVGGFFTSLADRFTDRILDNLAEDLADIVMGAFDGKDGGGGGWLSSIFSLFGKRATGGPVMAGQPYIVGERRPEVFVPNVSGTVIPSVNAAMNRAQASRGGGGVVEHRIVVVPERESFITLATSAAQPVGFVAASAAIAQGRADNQNAQRVAPYRRG